MSSFQQNVIKHKVGLLNLAAELGNVSRACKVMGFSRDTFYRYQAARDEGGVDALIDANRRKPNPKNRVEEATESAVTAFALEQPAFGQVRVSNELRQRGVFVSPSGVRSVWLRHNLESFKKRLSALERYVAETGNVLTEAGIHPGEKAINGALFKSSNLGADFQKIVGIRRDWLATPRDAYQWPSIR